MSPFDSYFNSMQNNQSDARLMYLQAQSANAYQDSLLQLKMQQLRDEKRSEASEPNPVLLLLE